MHEIGEPLSRGRSDRRNGDAPAFRDALLGVALFGLVVLVNAILAILFIGWAQAVGWWEVSLSDGAERAATELSSRLHLRAAGAGSV